MKSYEKVRVSGEEMKEVEKFKYLSDDMGQEKVQRLLDGRKVWGSNGKVLNGEHM